MTGKRRRTPEPKRRPSTASAASPSSAGSRAGSASPASASSQPLVVAPRLTRLQARRNRRRQRRQRVGLAGGLVIAVVAVIVIAAVGFGVHKVVTSRGGSTRSQQTLLLQVQGSDHSAVATALLAEDPATKAGVEVLVPGRVITDVCGYGSENFGGVLALPDGITNSRQTLATMLNGVTIDGSWVLTASQLAGLVDALHGITVDVDTNVVQHTSGGGGKILVPQGSGQLDGNQAVEYATYATSSQEDASGQLTRLQGVIDGIMHALPRSPTVVAALVRRLGHGADSTLGADRLASFLVAYSGDYATQSGIFPTDLPVTAIDAGGTPSYRVDASSTGVPQLVHTQLAASLPKGAGKTEPTVLLLNGVGTPGLVATACPRLASHGLAYAGSDNAGTFSNAKSVVAISSDNAVDLGNQVARALGLPTSDVELDRADQSVADVIVTLGSDYKR
jgi:anionic cell wall polymer biosynthesis LytR-Cps2A-Psr (LCP) family protein